jgi:DNA-binding transcriptional MocR family regulator
LTNDGPSFSLEQRVSVLKRSKAPPHAQHVLAALLFRMSYHDGELVCWPSQRDLSELTNLHRSQVQRNLGKLASLGIISAETRRGGHSHQSNRYVLLLTPDGDALPAARLTDRRDAPVAVPTSPPKRGRCASCEHQPLAVPDDGRCPRCGGTEWWPLKTCRKCGEEILGPHWPATCPGCGKPRGA